MIVFDNVAYSYGGDALLSDVSLRLAPGSFHFLTGPSGAGKTTLLRLAYAELMPSKGRIDLFDRDVTTLSRDEIARSRRRMGIVHQDCQFLDHLPLAANVLLPLSVSGKDTVPNDLTDLLSWVGLSSLADAVPPQLSGGERQRAAVARALVTQPRIVLADEPTGNLDGAHARQVFELMLELNRELGTSLVIVTHDHSLASRMDRVLVLEDGILRESAA
jgi:cell division transport system ATP-binding protein